MLISSAGNGMEKWVRSLKEEGAHQKYFSHSILKRFPTLNIWTLDNKYLTRVINERIYSQPPPLIMPIFILAKQQCNKTNFRCIDNSIYLYFLKITAWKSSGMTSLVPLMQHSPSKQKPTFSRFGSKSKMVVEPPILAYLFKVWIKMGVKPHVLAWLI